MEVIERYLLLMSRIVIFTPNIDDVTCPLKVQIFLSASGEIREINSLKK